MIKAIFKRSGLHFSASVLNKILTSSVYIAMSWYIPPKIFGQGILSVTLILLGNVIGDFGLTQWYQKQEDEEKAFELFAKLRLLLALCVSVAIFLITYTLDWLPLTLNIITCIALFPYSLISIANAYLIRQKQVLKSTVWQLIQVTPMFFIIFIRQHNLQINEVFLANLLGVSIAVCVIFPFHKLSRIWRRKGERESLYGALRSSSKYALLNYTSVAYARADSLLVRSYLGEAALGFYGLAYRYLEYFALFPSSLVQMLFPVFAQNKKVNGRHIVLLTIITVALGIFFGAMLYLSSNFIITQFHGDSYLPSIAAMQLLSLTLVLLFINAPLATFVQASDSVKKFLPFGIANTLLNIVLNVVLIPVYGISGAAIVMCITEFTGLIINVVFTRKVLASYELK